MSLAGRAYWYELTSADPQVSGQFYAHVLGWDVKDAGFPSLHYLIGSTEEGMVAGITPPLVEPSPEHWVIYFEVESCDQTLAKLRALGGEVVIEPEDIPETGRFALCADPQGAVFGIIQPISGQGSRAFSQMTAGHGAWHELHSSAPEAAFDFYATLFSWEKSEGFVMGELGLYQLFSHQSKDIGGMMRLIGPEGVVPHWTAYFHAPSMGLAVERIEAGGGRVLQQPSPVPGGAFILLAEDPRGTQFALVGGP